jgi:O-antigen ligase
LAFIFIAFLFRPKLSPKAIIGVLLLVVTISLVFAGLVGQAKQFKIRKYGLENSQTRLIYSQLAFENFMVKPWVGSGLDTFQFVSRTSEKTTQLSTNYAHNFFLQMFSDAGILGFLTSFGLVFSVLWLGLKKIKEKGQTKERLLLMMFWLGILASALNGLVDFDWQIPTVFFLFCLIGGLFFKNNPL